MIVHATTARRDRDTAAAVRGRGTIHDHALRAFLDDTAELGLDRDVLLVITGEFGRTPRINGGAGRDALGAGPGWRPRNGPGGRPVERPAEYPKTTPITPQDLMATAFHTLGLPQNLHFEDLTGCPVPMIEGGKPIAELV